jgi:hypothetical protein
MTDHTATPWEFDGNCGGYIIQDGDKIARAYARADAEFIAKAVNNHDALVSALTELSKMYANTWDRVDGGLMMMGNTIDRFERAHDTAHRLLCTIKGEPLPISLGDEDEQANAGSVRSAG